MIIKEVDFGAISASSKINFGRCFEWIFIKSMSLCPIKKRAINNSQVIGWPAVVQNNLLFCTQSHTMEKMKCFWGKQNHFYDPKNPSPDHSANTYIVLLWHRDSSWMPCQENKSMWLWNTLTSQSLACKQTISGCILA